MLYMKIIFYKIRHVKYVNSYLYIRPGTGAEQGTAVHFDISLHTIAQTTVLEFHCTCTRSLILTSLRADN